MISVQKILFVRICFCMSSNEILSKTRKIIVHLLTYTRNTIVYRQSFLYLHNQISSFYKSLQVFEIRDLNFIEIQKFQQFFSLSTQILSILKFLCHFDARAIFICPLYHIFYKINKMENIIIELSNVISLKETKIEYNADTILQNQISDLQHIKIILSTLKMSLPSILNIHDFEFFTNFYLDIINNYFERNYDEVIDIIKNLNASFSISDNKIKQMKKELSLYKSINIPNDDIKISKKLDSDLFSTLYLATNLTTGEILTVKEVNMNQITKEIWIPIYSNLVQMSLIKHPSILEVVGASFCEPYRIMTPYFKGRSLFELINDQNNSTQIEFQLNRIAYQIANGMMFLHSNGIAHFDLNSSNILIDDNGAVKIANLGVTGMIFPKNYNKNEADIFSSKQECYQLIGNLGKPNYMAPEVLKKKKISPKADVYSYGIILWEMATKQIPFNNMSYQNIYEHVVSKNRRLPITLPISNELIKLINLCWSENPNDRPEFSEIIDLFNKGKIKLESDTKQLLASNDFSLSILFDYEYIESVLTNPSNPKFPFLVKFLLKNMTSEVYEKIRSIYSLSKESVSLSSFTSLFISFASCLNLDSLVILAANILNSAEFLLFIKLCGMTIIHSISTYSSISLLASFAEFFSKVPDDCFDLIPEYTTQLANRILSSSTLTKISFSFQSKLDSEIPFYIFHFISRLDNSKFLMSHRMQIYIYFSCEMIESIDKQTDIDEFAKILPLIEEYMTNEQVDSIIQILKKDLIIPFSVFEFLLKKMNKDRLNNVAMILLESSLTKNIESTLFNFLQLLTDNDFDCFLANIDDVFEILQIMIAENISTKIALFILSRLTKLSAIQNYILNTFQFGLLNLVLDTENNLETKIEIFTNLYSNELFCNEMRNNQITSKIIRLIINSFQNASESSIKSILSFILSLSSHQIGCQILNEEDLLQTFSEIFFLASLKDLPLSLKIIINITNARMDVPRSSLIVSCLMNDLLKSKSNMILILTALRNIISNSYPCIQEIDLQHSIMPLISIDNEPNIIVCALQLLSACEPKILKNIYVQLIEKISVILSSIHSTDIVLSSINILNSISACFDLKPYLEQLKLIELIDSLIKSLKTNFPKIAEQLLNLKNRLVAL